MRPGNIFPDEIRENCPARWKFHLTVRIAVVIIVVLGACEHLAAPANPQHFDQARAWLNGTLFISQPTLTHDLIPMDLGWASPFPPLPTAVAVLALLAGRHANLAYNLVILATALLSMWLAGRIATRLGGMAAGTWAMAAIGPGSGLLVAAAFHDTYHSAHVLATASTLAAIDIVLGRRRSFAGGLLLGIAAIARQACILGALPLALLAGRRRFIGVLVGAALPFLIYIGLNWARFDAPLATGYEAAEHLPHLKADIAVHGAMSFHWIPRNLRALLTGLPRLVPVAPWIVPDLRGMALWLVSPWILLGLLPLVRPDRPTTRRIAALCWMAAGLISIPHLLYVNTGYAQIGSRFALDYLPFLLVTAILGVRRMRPTVPVILVSLSVLVNVWALVALWNYPEWAPYIPSPG